MKIKIILPLFLFFSLQAFCQSTTKEKIQKILERLPLETDKVKKAELLFEAATYYLEKEGERKKDLDSAIVLNNQSLKLRNELNLKEKVAQSLLLQGRIEVEKGNIEISKKNKKKALDYALKNNLQKDAASIYLSIAHDFTDAETDEKVTNFKNAIANFKATGLKSEQARALRELAEFYQNISEYDTSNIYAFQALKIQNELKNKNIQDNFIVIATNYRLKSDFKNALVYAQNAQKIIENTNSSESDFIHIYNLLGVIYYDLKLNSLSIENYKKALVYADKIKDGYAVNTISQNMVSILYRLRKSKEALEILSDVSKKYPSKQYETMYASMFVMIYCDLKKYDLAVPYYNKIVKAYDQGKDSGQGKHMISHAITMYLLRSGQANKMYPYLNDLKKDAEKENNILRLSELEGIYFKADSATGNYLSAIERLKNYKSLSDSVFNVKRAQQFSDLQVKYETEKKDKNIKMLEQQGQLQQTKLNNEIIIRYIFIVSLFVLFLLSGLLYSRYCMKRKGNAILETKQAEINKQNQKLRQLVDEKEWLIKEIHHRVKNNLQIVISLLNTQSAYLENEDAILAIQNSQHRMHAMSLIHQKLYQTENLSSIDMSWYIFELVNYLNDSFGTDHKIKFHLETDPIELDVVQAVPLGLILNEAISNSIKYAFPEKKGLINISLKKIASAKYSLKIADNGIGLQPNFENIERDSLGMNLMIGLTEQLDGTFKITSENGVTISIDFIKREADI